MKVTSVEHWSWLHKALYVEIFRDDMSPKVRRYIEVYSNETDELLYSYKIQFRSSSY